MVVLHFGKHSLVVLVIQIGTEDYNNIMNPTVLILAGIVVVLFGEGCVAGA